MASGTVSTITQGVQELPITYTNNTLVDNINIEGSGVKAYKRNGVLIFHFYVRLNNVSVNDFVEVCKVSGWSAKDTARQSIITDSGTYRWGAIDITASGSVRLYVSGSGANVVRTELIALEA